MATGTKHAARLTDHWWPRPGWRPGRIMLTWHLTFEGSPGLHGHVYEYQRALDHLPGLNLVPVEWLHLTIQGLGYADETSPETVDAVVDAVRAEVAQVPAFELIFDRPVIYGEAIAIRPDPAEPLQQLLTAIRAGTAAVLGPDAVPTGPEQARGFHPHVSIAYSHINADAGAHSHALGSGDAPPAITRVHSVALIRQERILEPHWLYRWTIEATAPLRAVIWMLTMVDPLPKNLPAPENDGAVDHLPGRPVPPLALTSTDGATVRLDQLGADRTVLYCYPLTGRADIDLPDGWDSIPGARGCTNEACDFRDHHADLLAAGAAAVYGVSTQTSAYQAELVTRLQLPFAMLSDPDRALAAHLDLPTFDAGGMTLYRRHTLVVRGGVIEHVFYPVFPPDQHASEVLTWLRSHRRE